MPQTSHVEKHFTASATVRDIVIGMSDGLTVPFALAAGMSGAVSVTTLVVTAGLAEIVAGSISMGLGGYLAGRTDEEHYESERQREIRETEDIPELETKEVEDIFRGYGLSDDELKPVVTAICSDQTRWVDFMMRYELGLEQPESGRARQSAITIAVAYVVGGFIPLAPYIFIQHDVNLALYTSVVVTLIALYLFGFVKGTFTGSRPFRSAFRTAVIGGVAAAAAFVIAKLIA